MMDEVLGVCELCLWLVVVLDRSWSRSRLEVYLHRSYGLDIRSGEDKTIQ